MILPKVSDFAWAKAITPVYQPSEPRDFLVGAYDAFTQLENGNIIYAFTA